MFKQNYWVNFYVILELDSITFLFNKKLIYLVTNVNNGVGIVF